MTREEKRIVRELYSALSGIVTIGKRDMSNPKYDGYFLSAKNALDRADELNLELEADGI